MRERNGRAGTARTPSASSTGCLAPHTKSVHSLLIPPQFKVITCLENLRTWFLRNLQRNFFFKLSIVGGRFVRDTFRGVPSAALTIRIIIPTERH